MKTLAKTIALAFLLLALFRCSIILAATIGNSVTVAWDRNPEPDVDLYKVYYGPVGSGTTNSVPAGNNLQQAVTNLTYDVEHWFYVTANNTVGLESDPSTVLTYTPILGAPPVPPASVTVAWDPNPETDIAGYRVYSGEVGTTITNMVDVATTSSPVTNLTRSVEHWFYVTAYNTYGLESDPSTVLTYTPSEFPTPHRPTLRVKR